MGSVGERLRALRIKAGLSLAKLGELTGSSRSYIWELENNNVPRPSARKLVKIADRLDTTLDYLLDGIKSEEDSTDASFYRRYLKMCPAMKTKARQIVGILTSEARSDG